MEQPNAQLRKLEKLAKTLSEGFETLLSEVKDLSRSEAAFKRRLNFAYDEYCKLASDPSLDHDGRNRRTKVAWQIAGEEADPQQMNGVTSPNPIQIHLNTIIQEALMACTVVRGMSKGPPAVTVRTCPVTKQKTDQEDFEHDFTTPGLTGNLECPFAKIAQNGVTLTVQNGIADPIAAEFHQDKISIQSPSTTAPGASKCPIRFLDQHSPEEVAQYFENHKHEIPRSHEICVKRYQQNNESIRQLDAKYGNLVNMIQGLGVKHRQYLPFKEEEEEVHDRPRFAEAIEKWGEDVSHRSDHAALDHPPKNPVEEGEPRTPRFERSLREIRVGESPSRPWGISVPVAQEPTESAIRSDRGIEPPSVAHSEDSTSYVGKNSTKRGKCSCNQKFRKVQVNGVPPEKPRTAGSVDGQGGKPVLLPSSTSSQPMVFTGPVFFGYSPDQVVSMMQAGFFSGGEG